MTPEKQQQLQQHLNAIRLKPRFALDGGLGSGFEDTIDGNHIGSIGLLVDKNSENKNRDCC